jgi:selenocysteine-specific elongation factor
MLTFGTAGHIDHGKSSLIYNLTAIDPDRLPEEKRRGMTIDLGFAWLTLSSGEKIGIVDVPGHKQLVHNVIPGLYGIDAVILVVAADDGWMPQTTEHIQIINLLGINNGIVALTKVDLADDDSWLDLIEQDILRHLATTPLCESEIIRIDNKSGAGIDLLRDKIEKMAKSINSRINIGKPRLPIDRVFTMKGSGVIVTGTLSGGYFSVGDEIMVMPSRYQAMVRGIQSYKTNLPRAEPGSRVALNLTGLKRENLYRGHVIVSRGQYQTSSAILDVYLQLLPGNQEIKNGEEVVIFLETSEVLARIFLFDRKKMLSSEKSLAQIRLKDEVAAYIGEVFVIRKESPPITLGGGVILDPQAVKHRQKELAFIVANLKERQTLKLNDLVLAEIRKLGFINKKRLLAASSFTEREVADALSYLSSEGEILVFDENVVDRTFLSTLEDKSRNILAIEHRSKPHEKGLSQAELQSRLGLRKDLFDSLLNQLTVENKIIHEGNIIALYGHKPSLTQEQIKVAGKILTSFTENKSSPPSKGELRARYPNQEDVISFLIQQGELKEMVGSILLTTEQFVKTKETIIDFLKEKGEITIQDMNKVFGYSRKYSIPILTQLDSEGITRREQNVRKLAQKPNLDSSDQAVL